MTSQETLTRRHRHQFRLRTLLIVSVLFTVPFAWLYWEREQRRREQEVTVWVKEKRGRVEYENDWLNQWIGGRVIWVEFYPSPVSDLTPLADLGHLKELHLAGTQVSDVTPLAGLKNLVSLDLTSTQVSEEQVEMLRKALPNCKILR